MPRLSVWMVRAGLIYFGLGFTFGALMLFNKGVPLSPQLWRLLSPHVEFLLLGWTMQLAMGVAFWILPRLSGGRGRGSVTLAWVAFVLLNAGVLSVAASGWAGGPPGIALAGRAAELLAGVAFAAHSWPRVKPLGV